MLAGFIKKQVQKYEGGVDLESNKAVSITSNGTTVVSPSSGKDGMEQVTVTTNVPSSASDLEANKTATIDVSAYTEPVEINHSSGKDGMVKATVTLTNIPDLENEKAQTIDVSTYTGAVTVNPTSGKTAMKKATITLSNIPSGSGGCTLYAWKYGQDYRYTESASPEVDDKAWRGIEGGFIGYQSIESVGTGTIEVDGDIYERYADGDIMINGGGSLPNELHLYYGIETTGGGGDSRSFITTEEIDGTGTYTVFVGEDLTPIDMYDKLDLESCGQVLITVEDDGCEYRGYFSYNDKTYDIYIGES